MANYQIANAMLRDWRGPFFPPALERLHAVYAANPLTESSIASLIRKLEIPCLDHGQEITSDDYRWFKCIEVGLPVLFKICFPWSKDTERVNGTSTDRHLALYLSGIDQLAVDDSRLISTIEKIAEAWEALPVPKQYTGR